MASNSENRQVITSAANQHVKQVIAWQTKSKERRKDKVFLVEGVKMFEEAPESRILEVYVSESAYEKANEDIKNKLDRVGFNLITDDIFKKMSDTQTPQGILTVVKQPEYRLEDIIKADNPLLVVLENLQDPGNLGTIVRTGEGAGITGVILSKTTVDIYNPKTIRATMGSIYRVPFVYVEDLKDTLVQMKEAGITSYAAHLKGDNYYSSFSFTQPTAFLIGNEGNGLTDEISEIADHYLKIPMEGKVESLNAAIATSLLIYETHRQRSL